MSRTDAPWQDRRLATASERHDRHAAIAQRNELIHLAVTAGIPSKIIAGGLGITRARVLQIAKLWK